MFTKVAIELIDPTQKCLRSGKFPNVIIKLPDLVIQHSTKEELPVKIAPTLTAFKNYLDVLNAVPENFTPDHVEVIVTLEYDDGDGVSVFKPVKDMFDIPSRMRELL